MRRFATLLSLACGCTLPEAEVEPPLLPQVENAPPVNNAGPLETDRHADRLETPPMDARWTQAVLTIAAGFHTWGRLEDEARWAPYLCGAPMPASARLSTTQEPQAHAEKLYVLHALDPTELGYPATTSWGFLEPGTELSAQQTTLSPSIQQAIVKESFEPVRGITPRHTGYRELSPAVVDGEPFVPGDPLDLYIMFRVEDRSETDEGWIYATVAPDRTTITAMGVIDSCASCHAQAGPGRVFSVVDAPTAKNAAR